MSATVDLLAARAADLSGPVALQVAMTPFIRGLVPHM
jgi:hypothetical protein